MNKYKVRIKDHSCDTHGIYDLMDSDGLITATKNGCYFIIAEAPVRLYESEIEIVSLIEPDYYDNSDGSLYLLSRTRNWSFYLSDIVKRLLRTKDDKVLELSKTLLVLNIWRRELGVQASDSHFNKVKSSSEELDYLLSKLDSEEDLEVNLDDCIKYLEERIKVV
jgi:hypothetical protein